MGPTHRHTPFPFAFSFVSTPTISASSYSMAPLTHLHPLDMLRSLHLLFLLCTILLLIIAITSTTTSASSSEVTHPELEREMMLYVQLVIHLLAFALVYYYQSASISRNSSHRDTEEEEEEKEKAEGTMKKIKTKSHFRGEIRPFFRNSILVILLVFYGVFVVRNSLTLFSRTAGVCLAGARDDNHHHSDDSSNNNNKNNGGGWTSCGIHVAIVVLTVVLICLHILAIFVERASVARTIKKSTAEENAGKGIYGWMDVNDPRWWLWWSGLDPIIQKQQVLVRTLVQETAAAGTENMMMETEVEALPPYERHCDRDCGAVVVMDMTRLESIHRVQGWSHGTRTQPVPSTPMQPIPSSKA